MFNFILVLTKLQIVSNISEPHADSIVHFTNPLHDIEVCEGDPADLELSVSNLNTEVTWVCNGISLCESSRISMISDGYERKFRIHSTTPSDTGLYACLIPKCNARTFAHVTVHKRQSDLRERALEQLRIYQKFMILWEEGAVESLTVMICIIVLLYMWCLYFCQELLERDFPQVFEKDY